MVFEGGKTTLVLLNVLVQQSFQEPLFTRTYLGGTKELTNNSVISTPHFRSHSQLLRLPVEKTYNFKTHRSGCLKVVQRQRLCRSDDIHYEA